MHAGSAGLDAASCVTVAAAATGDAGPTGSARLTAMRVSAPPCRACHSRSRASPSAVTTLATRRPPAGRLAHACASKPALPIPPPIKIASGCGRPVERLGCGARARCANPAPRARRHCARSSRRAPGRARWRWPSGPRRRAAIRSRSSRSPLRHPTGFRRATGASAARVAARTSRLVSWPSCSKTSSGRPASSGNARAPGAGAAGDRDRVEVGNPAIAPGLRLVGDDDLRLPPRWASTVSRLGPQPSPVSSAATALGVPPSSDRISMRRLRGEMQPQGVERPAVQGDRRAVGERPTEPRGRQAEGARLRQDRHLLARKAAGQGDADAVPHRVAAGQHGHPPAAAGFDRVDRPPQRPLPDDPLGAAVRHHAEMARAADQHLGGFDQRTRCRREAGDPVLADADNGEPGCHPALASALTAAAASALPPRRPCSVMNWSPCPNAASAALASAAPTKPTGKPRTRAGFGRTLREHFEQPEQRRRCVADRDHRARQMRAPEIDRGSRAGRASRRCQRRRLGIAQSADDGFPPAAARS